MAAKRAAGKQLTHDNWEEEDEPEEAGSFPQAEDEELKNRVIKKAKRRVMASESNSGQGLFKGFTGFKPSAPPSSGFSFGKSQPESSKALIEGKGRTEDNGQTEDKYEMEKAQSTDGSSTTIADINPAKDIFQNAAEPCDAAGDAEEEKRKSQFLGSLKALNESILKWLHVHMDRNAYCIFTPVFDDYRKHLVEIETKYGCTPEVSTTVEVSKTISKNESLTSKSSNGSGHTKAFGDVSVTPLISTSLPNQPTFGGSALPSQPPTLPSQPSTLPSQPAAQPSFAFSSTQSVAGGSFPNLFGSAAAAKQMVPVAASDQKRLDGSVPAGAPGADKASESATTQKVQALSTAVPLSSQGFMFGKTSSDQQSASSFQSPFSASSLFPTSSQKTIDATSSDTSGQAVKSSLFSFGKPTTSAPQSVFGGATFNPTFTFATGSKAPDGAGGGLVFGGSSAAGFSFKPAIVSSTFAAAAREDQESTNDDEEYVPPKPEVTNQVKEEGALYTKRVKLFYEKDGKYVEKGVGNLFIKPTENGKNSVLVRADTNLGNILLNILLGEKIPVVRSGTNNVTMVCIPNPLMDPKDKKDKSVTLLIRVKTAEDADELCAQLNKYKN